MVRAELVAKYIIAEFIDCGGALCGEELFEEMFIFIMLTLL